MKYENNTLFKWTCEECKKTIYPNEKIVIEYIDTKGNNIDVAEAYRRGQKPDFERIRSRITCKKCN